MTSKKLTIAAVAVCLMAVGAAAQGRGGILPPDNFTDSRDNQTYRTVKIGNLTWMAENLDYQTEDSWCYDDDDSNCAKYGRLYTWDAAMAACPAGWRLPDTTDWDSLTAAVGGGVYSSGYWENAGTKLKARVGWKMIGNDDYIPATDDYGFSALPGGYRFADGSFNFAGYYGRWWCSTEHEAARAWNRLMHYHHDYVSRYRNLKTGAFSVRCVMGDK